MNLTELIKLHFDAVEQEKLWTALKESLSAQILDQMKPGDRAEVEDVECAIRQSQRKELDIASFNAFVAQAIRQGDLDLDAALFGVDKWDLPMLPGAVQDVAETLSSMKPTRPWVETKRKRKRL